jgi:hypothetical protein
VPATLLSPLAERTCFSQVPTIKMVDVVTQFLLLQGVEAVCYHGSMSAPARREAHRKFIHDIARVIVGLGRTVALHYRASTLYHIFTSIIGTSFSETTMRPDPR